MGKNALRLKLLVSCAVVLASCNWKLKPTFPAAQVAGAVKQLCAKDYHLTVEARHKNNALQIFFWRVGLFKSNHEDLRSEAAKSLEHALLCATRVALSTDAPLKFLEIRMADVLTGATITLWRYIPDIQDSMYTRFSEEEYMNRLVIDMNAGEGRALEGATPHWDLPLTMAEFLAKQVVQRAKRQSPVGIQAHEDLTKPETLVVVIDNWAAIEKEDIKQTTKVAESVEKTARAVLRGYRFNEFRGLVLQDHRGAALRSWTL
jgi:hypothetical protein